MLHQRTHVPATPVAQLPSTQASVDIARAKEGSDLWILAEKLALMCLSIHMHSPNQASPLSKLHMTSFQSLPTLAIKW